MKHFDPVKYLLENSTLDDLISWLETKPRNATYDYGNPKRANILKNHGVMEPSVSTIDWGIMPYGATCMLCH